MNKQTKNDLRIVEDLKERSGINSRLEPLPISYDVFEDNRDDIELQILQMSRMNGIQHGISDPESYRLNDLGITQRYEANVGRDGGYGEDIQKVINKVKSPTFTKADDIMGRLLWKPMAYGYYNYVKLMKALGKPVHKIKVTPWNAPYLADMLPRINSVVYLEEGDYSLGTTLAFDGSAIITRGEGDSTNLVGAAALSGPLMNVTGSYNWMEGFAINGNKATATSGTHGIVVNATRARIHQIWAYNMNGNAVDMGSGCLGGKVGRLVTGNTTPQQNTGDGINIGTGATDIEVTDSLIRESIGATAAGIRMNDSGNTVIGTHLWGNTRDFVILDTGIASLSRIYLQNLGFRDNIQHAFVSANADATLHSVRNLTLVNCDFWKQGWWNSTATTAGGAGSAPNTYDAMSITGGNLYNLIMYGCTIKGVNWDTADTKYTRYGLSITTAGVVSGTQIGALNIEGMGTGPFNMSAAIFNNINWGTFVVDYNSYSPSNFYIPTTTVLWIDHTGVGEKCTVQAGATVTTMQVLTLNASNKWVPADADAETTGGPLLLALEGASANANFSALKKGIVRDDSWAWTIGTGTSNVLYISTTAGTLSQSYPIGTGDVVQVAGYALTPTQIMFDPQLSWGVLV